MKHLDKLPLLLLCLFTGKLMILNTWSYESAIVLLSLALVTGLFHYIATKDQLKVINDTLKDHSKLFEEVKNENEKLKTHVSGLKLANSMRPTQQKTF